MTKQIRRIRQLLRLEKWIDPAGTFTHQARAYTLARQIIRIFYWVILFEVSRLLTGSWLAWQTLEEIAPVWPVAWISLTGIPLGINLIGASAYLTAILAALFTERRIFRILLAISFLMLIGFWNSFGKINHGYHTWLAVTFFFIFLPDGNWQDIEKSIGKRHQFLTVFWSAQAAIFFFYSMSGFLKIGWGLVQMVSGEYGLFHPLGFSYQVAQSLVKTNETALLADFVINNPLLGWPLYILAALFETFAIIAAFRPKAHRTWGTFLALFHVGSFFIMNIRFITNILLLGLLFVNSPFAPAGFHIPTILRNLPITGDLIHLYNKHKNTPTQPNPQKSA